MGATPPRSRALVERCLPIVGWIRRYAIIDLRFDALAGLTVAAFAVPESLAYASLAGLPPATGLYAGIVAMLTYAVLGSSRQLATGVTSALAILTAGTVGGLAGGDPKQAAVAAALAAVVAGAAGVLGWLCRLGFLASLVSRSVLVGFSAGAGIYIGSTQLAKLFGVQSGHGEFFSRMVSFFGHVRDTNGWSLAVGLVAIGLLALGRKTAPKWPSSLVVVVVALVAAPMLGLAERGVAIVGAIASGLPVPSMPTSAWSEWKAIVPLGLSLFVLSYVEGVSAARSLAATHGGRVDSNQEMLANGVGNAVAGLFQGMAVGGSLTRSSVNVQAGARTPLAGAVGGVAMLVVVAWFTGVFRNLPEPVLAAIILAAAVELVDVHALVRLFVLSKREFAIAIATGVGVLVFGMLWGVVIGVATSLLDLLERAAFPHTAELGLVPGTTHYADRGIHPEYASIEGVLVVRIDASLVFANAHEVRQDVLQRLETADRSIHLLVLDLEASPVVDLSGVEALDRLRTSLDERGVMLRLAGVKAEVRGLLAAAAPGRFDDLHAGTDTSEVIQSCSRYSYV